MEKVTTDDYSSKKISNNYSSPDHNDTTRNARLSDNDIRGT